MNKSISFIIILVVVAAGVFWFLGSRGSKKVISPTLTPMPTSTQPGTAVIPKTVVINMTDSGFNPAEVVINAGDAVRFINQSSQGRWLASAVHPTHEFYPGSSISKCSSLGSMAIFDACRGLQKGESFSFTFNEKGTWPYHDHLAPLTRGKIIVR